MFLVDSGSRAITDFSVFHFLRILKIPSSTFVIVALATRWKSLIKPFIGAISKTS